MTITIVELEIFMSMDYRAPDSKTEYTSIRHADIKTAGEVVLTL